VGGVVGVGVGGREGGREGALACRVNLDLNHSPIPIAV
jgi:hypothetical protein